MIIAANWKMNLTADEARDLAAFYADLAIKSSGHHCDVLVFAPALYAGILSDAASDSQLGWGGQSGHHLEKGAHTGDISAPMFASLGAKWMLAGHSERRQYHHETDAQIAAQLALAQGADMNVILCVGETLAQRQAGIAGDVICQQLQDGLSQNQHWDSIVIAYEPVWAIGTGQVASLADISDMHQIIIDFIADNLKASQKPPILYGGSVKADNASQILALDNVDGALIGGASLLQEQMTSIHKSALEIG